MCYLGDLSATHTSFRQAGKLLVALSILKYSWQKLKETPYNYWGKSYNWVIIFLSEGKIPFRHKKEAGKYKLSLGATSSVIHRQLLVILSEIRKSLLRDGSLTWKQSTVFCVFLCRISPVLIGITQVNSNNVPIVLDIRSIIGYVVGLRTSIASSISKLKS